MGSQIVLLGQYYAYATTGKVTRNANAVDAAANHKHIAGVRVGSAMPAQQSTGVGIGHAISSFSGGALGRRRASFNRPTQNCSLVFACFLFIAHFSQMQAFTNYIVFSYLFH
jgi:hypothetical protein